MIKKILLILLLSFNLCFAQYTVRIIKPSSTLGDSVDETEMSLSDTTLLNASATQHGFLLKLTNTGTQWLRDDGTWQTIAGGGDMLKSVYDINEDDKVDSGAVDMELIYTKTETNNLLADKVDTPIIEEDPIWTAWDGISGIATATPSDGDITHVSTADQIYDWVILQNYLTTYTESDPVVKALTGIIVSNGSSISAITNSSGLAGQLDDETGSGVLVFGTAPTFTTSITVPLILTGNVPMTIGDATTDAITFTTDGTGNAEIVLPADSIGAAELDNTWIDDLNAFTPAAADEFVAYDDTAGTSAKITWTNLLTAIQNTFDASSELAAIMDDETGSDTIVFATSPTIVTPTIAGSTMTGVNDAGGATSFEIPNSTSDATLTDTGQVHFNSTDEQFSFHSGEDGEITGEASISLLRHYTAVFDPSTMYDQDATYHNIPLFTVGDDAPEGIKIVEWKCDYSTGDPTTELDADLYFATDYAEADSTLIDVIDTTAGSSSEDINANIYSGNAIPNAKKVYISFGADPTDANVLVIFEMWFYNEED